MRSARTAATALVLVVAPLPIFPAAAAAATLKAIVFDVEPAHLTLSPQLQQRLDAGTALVRKFVANHGFDIVDTAPQNAKIKDNLPLSQCNGCDQDIAKALGADIEVTTAVQSSSSVTFEISGNIKDVKTNRVLREGVVDIHGEDGDVWNHGFKFLLKERLFEPPVPADDAGLRKLVEDVSKAKP